MASFLSLLFVGLLACSPTFAFPVQDDISNDDFSLNDGAFDQGKDMMDKNYSNLYQVLIISHITYFEGVNKNPKHVVKIRI